MWYDWLKSTQVFCQACCSSRQFVYSAGTPGYDVRPGLRVAQQLDRALDGAEQVFQAPITHGLPPLSSGRRRVRVLSEIAGDQQLPVRAQVLRVVLEHEPAVGQHVGAVGDLERELDVLLDEQHGGAQLLGDAAQDRQQPLDDHGREPEAHLVDQQQPRRAAQRARRRRASAARRPTARRPCGPGTCAARAALEELSRPRRSPRAEPEVLATVRPKNSAAALGHERDAAARELCGGDAGQVLAGERDAPADAAAAARRSWPASSSCPRRWGRAARPPRRRPPWSEIAHDRHAVVAGRGPRARAGRSGIAPPPSRRAAEVGGDRPRVVADLRRRAAGDDLAEVEHDDLVADAEHEAHVVVDEQHGHAPSGSARRCRPSSSLSSVSRPAAGSSISTRRGRWRARGRRRRACAGRGRARSAGGRRRRSARAARAPSRPRRAGARRSAADRSRSAEARPCAGWRRARFSPTVRSSNSSTTATSARGRGAPGRAAAAVMSCAVELDRAARGGR